MMACLANNEVDFKGASHAETVC